MRKASGSDGSKRPFSIALMELRETRTRSASSAWLQPSFAIKLREASPPGSGSFRLLPVRGSGFLPLVVTIAGVGLSFLLERVRFTYQAGRSSVSLLLLAMT